MSAVVTLKLICGSPEPATPKLKAVSIRDHYSGHSIRYAQRAGGPINTEAYFDPNGTYKLVALDGTPIFATGTWRANEATLPTLQIEAQDFFIDDGQTRSRSSSPRLFWIYIQPDGSVTADLVGGGNFDQPRPTPGFQAAELYNGLRRQAGL